MLGSCNADAGSPVWVAVYHVMCQVAESLVGCFELIQVPSFLGPRYWKDQTMHTCCNGPLFLERFVWKDALS